MQKPILGRFDKPLDWWINPWTDNMQKKKKKKHELSPLINYIPAFFSLWFENKPMLTSTPSSVLLSFPTVLRRSTCIADNRPLNSCRQKSWVSATTLPLRALFPHYGGLYSKFHLGDGLASFCRPLAHGMGG